MVETILAGYRVDTAIVNKVTSAALAHGVPVNVLLAIVLAESGGNPTIAGDGATSFGLLQLHYGGGQADGYPLAEVLDPDRNLAIGTPPIAAAWRAAGDLTGAARVAATCAKSGHPGDPAAVSDPEPVQRNIDRIVAIWRNLEAASPTTASAGASVVGLPIEAVYDSISRGLAYAQAHPLEAAALAVGVLVLLS